MGFLAFIIAITGAGISINLYVIGLRLGEIARAIRNDGGR